MKSYALAPYFCLVPGTHTGHVIKTSGVCESLTSNHEHSFIQPREFHRDKANGRNGDLGKTNARDGDRNKTHTLQFD